LDLFSAPIFACACAVDDAAAMSSADKRTTSRTKKEFRMIEFPDGLPTEW
jgi:hypothetical protein